VPLDQSGHGYLARVAALGVDRGERHRLRSHI